MRIRNLRQIRSETLDTSNFPKMSAYPPNSGDVIQRARRGQEQTTSPDHERRCRVCRIAPLNKRSPPRP